MLQNPSKLGDLLPYVNFDCQFSVEYAASWFPVIRIQIPISHLTLLGKFGVEYLGLHNYLDKAVHGMWNYDNWILADGTIK